MPPEAPTIPSRFAGTVAHCGRRVAVGGPSGQWSYEELDRRSEAIAAEIQRRLGKDSEPVALLMAHDAPLIAAILGTLKADKMYVALDPTPPPAQVAATLAASGARLLLADHDHLPLANSMIPSRTAVCAVPDDFSIRVPLECLPDIAGDSGAWLMFTSGSTDSPKGVWQNHRGLVNEAEVYAELIQLGPDDRVSLLAACGLAASGATLFGSLLTGATLCLFHLRSQGVERLADWLHQERITVFHTVPGVFRHLAHAANAREAMSSVRLIRLGGEPLLRGDVDLFRQVCPNDCILLQSYSSTETGMISTLRLDKQTALATSRVPVGRAVPGVEIFLVNEQGQPIQCGGEGKIAVRSRRLRQGYWRQPDLTAEKFRAGAEAAGGRVFVSNDLGKFLPDGTLEHLGRADQVVKILGQRVDLGEVEAALLATGLVREAAVTANEDASGTKQLAAYFVPRANATVSRQQFLHELRRRQLAEHMIPIHFVPLGELPLTAGGKIDRRALPLPTTRDKQNFGRRHGPLDSLEKRLARIWESVLHISPIGRFDDFYELGGTSLQSVEILLHIEEALGVTLPSSTLAEHSTIEKLSALLADYHYISSPSPLLPLRSGSGKRPLFLIHSGAGHVATYGLLARQVSDRPVYGLQSPGLQGECWPLMSVSALARRYLPEITAKDPCGPYLLGGACMGGLVALELAQMLVQQHRRVGLVALMDTLHPIRRWRQTAWKEKLYSPARDFIRDAFRILRWGFLRGTGIARQRRLLFGYRRFVANMNFLASRLYQPKPYQGTLTIFVSSGDSVKGGDRRLMMRRYARDSTVIAIPSNHVGLFARPAVHELVRELEIVLKQV